jgi:hypothetical protein
VTALFELAKVSCDAVNSLTSCRAVPSVFLSSTCYDLIDLRAELGSHLRSVGLQVVRSDAQDFAIEQDRNSIETCLVRVRESDYFVCILSQRYGPSLASVGYDDVSATHLEYREARASGKPVMFFVRDRLMGDYSLSRKMPGDPAFQPVFASAKDAGRLFAFIEEHEKLKKGSSVSNWVFPFASVVDLKEALSLQLALPIGEGRLRRLLEEQRLPVFYPRPGEGSSSGSTVTWKIRIQNVGAQAALDVRVSFYDMTNWKEIGSIMPGGEIEASFSLSFPLTKKTGAKTPIVFAIEFKTMYGDQLEALFYTEIRGKHIGGFRRHTINLVSTNTFTLRAGAERDVP